MNYLEEIAKYHCEWINSVKTYGEKQYAEDIVQEMYIKLVYYNSESKPFKDGKINKNYIFRTLYNMTLSFHKSKRNINKISIGDGFELPEDEIDFQSLNNLQAMDEAIDKLPWYEKKLIELHYKEGIPMVDISRGSGLGHSSISRSITKAKKEIKKNINGKAKKNKKD